LNYTRMLKYYSFVNEMYYNKLEKRSQDVFFNYLVFSHFSWYNGYSREPLRTWLFGIL